MADRNRRRILVLLAAATVPPIVLLSWLGIWILDQDREVERQRRGDALEIAAGTIAAGFERHLQSMADTLTRGDGLQLTAHGITPAPSAPVLFQPTAPPIDDTVSATFVDAELAEHRPGGLDRAMAAYRRLARDPDRRIRAGAVFRLGRVLRAAGDRAGALKMYADLREYDQTVVAGLPASLIARFAAARLLDDADDADALRAAAVDLATLLNRGGWAIDRPTFEHYAAAVRDWGGAAPDPEDVTRSAVACELWRTWRAGMLPASGRRLIAAHDGQAVLVIWIGSPDRPVARLASRAELEALFQPLWQPHEILVAAYDAAGQRLFGETLDDAVVLPGARTRLPFDLAVSAAETPAAAVRDAQRRWILIATLSMAFALMLAAAYGAYRATMREVRLARQQTDFVAAVSHEFRTPLTSMRHLLDLLATRGVTSGERRSHYYDLLSRETDRLRRMVESLLSFGRIEAGAHAWRLERVEVPRLVHDVIEEFHREPQARGRRIETAIPADLPPIVGDAEAVSRALWNLVENAAKYSPPEAPIAVFATLAGDRLLLGVTDRGAGIPPGERDLIFQKFVRGADATRMGVRGVGVGLALVKQIADVHRAQVRVESAPGAGSTFTIDFPVAAGETAPMADHPTAPANADTRS
jgi:signal transduction histidine kinase